MKEKGIKIELQVLKEKDIKIGDTDFSHSVVVKKMELSAPPDHYTRKEINAPRGKFTLMDASDGETSIFGEALMEAVELDTARVGDG